MSRRTKKEWQLVIRVYKQLEVIYKNGIRRVTPVFIRPVNHVYYSGKTVPKMVCTDQTYCKFIRETQQKINEDYYEVFGMTSLRRQLTTTCEKHETSDVDSDGNDDHQLVIEDIKPNINNLDKQLTSERQNQSIDELEVIDLVSDSDDDNDERNEDNGDDNSIILDIPEDNQTIINKNSRQVCRSKPVSSSTTTTTSNTSSVSTDKRTATKRKAYNTHQLDSQLDINSHKKKKKKRKKRYI